MRGRVRSKEEVNAHIEPMLGVSESPQTQNARNNPFISGLFDTLSSRIKPKPQTLFVTRGARFFNIILDYGSAISNSTAIMGITLE